ncbi:glycosyltransferase family 2 protein [Vibrio pectenicida]|uniref:Glycosyltransferase family 2 protein n=1 Tax=Vibrio pectenicida TaxID=62763 RepID=A0A7Y4A191_9VIBR|nr:glycosyltransferase family 2 protein [Vibrio pectenicida]NOH72653.1 glycosyltransferase family 2 protein [Vibrio pectenicida]
MLEIIIYIATMFFLFLVVRQYLNIKKSLEFLSKQETYKNSILNGSKFTLLIPVLDESSIIIETIKHFEKFIVNHPDMKLVLITTDKENNIENNKTYQAILPFVSQQIQLVNYPYKTGNKASQINYFIEQSNNSSLEQSNSYYAIFDADSRPDFRAFYYIYNDDEKCRIYQMPPMYSSNFEQLNMFSKAAAIFQTRWMLSYELPSLVKNYNAKKSICLSYCIGHGLFIRKDYLERHPFSTETVTEDLHYGYQAVVNRVYAKPVPYFDTCSIALGRKNATRQSARWFSGDLSSIFMAYLHHEPQEENFKLIFVKRLFRILLWLLGTILSASIILATVVLKMPFALFLFFTTGLAYIFLIHKSTIEEYFYVNENNKIYWYIFLKSISNC